MRPRQPHRQRLPSPHANWSAGPRDGGGISERPPPTPTDRGSPRTPLDGPYDHYGGYPGGPPLGAPIYPMRRCSESPGHPLMRMAYCGRSGERAGVPSGHRGQPLRLLERRMPQSPLEQLHVQQEQQYHAEVRRRHPSAWLGRRRSSSSSRSRSNGSYVASRGASSVLSLRRGSFIERDRSRSRSVSTISVNEASDSPRDDAGCSYEQQEQRRRRSWQDHPGGAATAASSRNRPPEGPFRRSLSRASDVSAVSSCESRSRRRWHQQQRGMVLLMHPSGPHSSSRWHAQQQEMLQRQCQQAWQQQHHMMLMQRRGNRCSRSVSSCRSVSPSSISSSGNRPQQQWRRDLSLDRRRHAQQKHRMRDRPMVATKAAGGAELSNRGSRLRDGGAKYKDNKASGVRYTPSCSSRSKGHGDTSGKEPCEATAGVAPTTRVDGKPQKTQEAAPVAAADADGSGSRRSWSRSSCAGSSSSSSSSSASSSLTRQPSRPESNTDATSRSLRIPEGSSGSVRESAGEAKSAIDSSGSSSRGSIAPIGRKRIAEEPHLADASGNQEEPGNSSRKRPRIAGEVEERNASNISCGSNNGMTHSICSTECKPTEQFRTAAAAPTAMARRACSESARDGALGVGGSSSRCSSSSSSGVNREEKLRWRQQCFYEFKAALSSKTNSPASPETATPAGATHACRDVEVQQQTQQQTQQLQPTTATTSAAATPLINGTLRDHFPSTNNKSSGGSENQAEPPISGGSGTPSVEKPDVSVASAGAGTEKRAAHRPAVVQVAAASPAAGPAARGLSKTSGSRWDKCPGGKVNGSLPLDSTAGGMFAATPAAPAVCNTSSSGRTDQQRQQAESDEEYAVDLSRCIPRPLPSRLAPPLGCSYENHKRFLSLIRSRRNLGKQWRLSVLELHQRQTEYLLLRIDHTAAVLAELEVLRRLLSESQATAAGGQAAESGARTAEGATAAIC
ncbi:hypothetical protein, conserved [Eimeria tenella]|uniref:Uncharacterized protein n=1 Tax=Eimeria tenella TaxID=5802 RepID=U6KZE0_EIMTE|nr:hypothetical protein, conserved [Eimeria tenella]CDJ41694.1 hypothetical protein, conserved [Eimeria tenella]|eukprot:XP_013232444.1 hypothetical protein, conserved [Eimeria tenella]